MHSPLLPSAQPSPRRPPSPARRLTTGARGGGTRRTWTRRAGGRGQGEDGMPSRSHPSRSQRKKGLSPIGAATTAKEQYRSRKPLATVPSNDRLARHRPVVTRIGHFRVEKCPNNPSQESKSRQLSLMQGW